MQELVYKNGQAGITKASVTITFDNSDKNQSPIGYERFDEVAIMRQARNYSISFDFFGSCHFFDRWWSAARTST